MSFAGCYNERPRGCDMPKRLFTVAAVLFLLGTTVHADIRITLRPGLEPYRDVLGYGAAIGVKSDLSSFVPTFKPGLFTGLEFYFSTASYTNLNFYNLMFGADIGYRFPLLNGWLSVSPYVCLGAGYINMTDITTNVDRWGFLAVPSLNAEYFLTRNWSAGLELSYRVFLVSLLTDPYNVGALNIGLTVSYSIPAGATAGGSDGPRSREEVLAGDLEKILKEQKLQGTVGAGEANEIRMSLSDVLFDSGSDRVSAKYTEAVKSIAKRVREYADTMVLVEGHSDDRGDETFNALLSAKRAKNVADLFIAFGIASTQVSYKGWGREKPVAPNNSEENRAKNRRVEIRFKFG